MTCAAESGRKAREMLRKRLNQCEHHWRFWGKIAVGGLVGDAYICDNCPTTEILVKFGSKQEMEDVLERGYQALEARPRDVEEKHDQPGPDSSP